MKFHSNLLAMASILQTQTLVTSQFAATPAFGGSQSCSQDSDCPLIQCLIPPCPDAVCVDGSCGVGNLNNPECVQDTDCPEHSCFSAPCPDESYCNAGVCDLRSIGSAVEGEDQSEQGGDSDLSCGPNTCEPGQFCCNRSCGYCVEPGGFCTEEFCLENESELLPEEDVPLGEEYACTIDSDCPAINCFVAPCDEYICDTTVGLCSVVQAEETENVNADDGGDAGEEAYLCDIDSDCPIINCLVAPCNQYVCDTEVGACIMAGEACGFDVSTNTTTDTNITAPARRICPSGRVCCNASCGICTLPGDACTQQICSDPSHSFSESQLRPNTTNASNNPNIIMNDTTMLSSTVSREGPTGLDKNETVGDDTEGVTATDGEPNTANSAEDVASSTGPAVPPMTFLALSLFVFVGASWFL